MPSSTKSLRPHLRTHTARGTKSYPVWDYSQSTRASLKGSESVSTSASPKFLEHTHLPIINPLISCLVYIAQLLVMSSPLVDTSALSHARSWRLSWAPFKLRRYHSYQKPLSLASTGQFTTFPSRTTPHPKPSPSTLALTAKSFRAHGERSKPWPSSLHVFPQTPKRQYAMWPRRTGPFQPTPRSGQAWSYAYRKRISLQSMSATTSAYRQPEACMERWQMQVRTFSEATASALSQSGSTTTSSSGFPAKPFQRITHHAPNGAKRFSNRAGASRTAVDSGTGERTSLMTRRRSLTRIAGLRSEISQKTPPAMWKTNSSHMQMRTSTSSPIVWASDGKRPRPYPLGRKFRTWASFGISRRARSAYWRTRGPSIWRPSRNGRTSAPTICSKHSSYMGSFTTPPRSSSPAVLTSPAWRPCWPPVIVVLSYRAPHPGTLQAIWNGGSSGLASQTSPPQSRNPNPSSTSKPSQTQARESALPSQWAGVGARGDCPPVGIPRAETSSGLRPSASNFSPSSYSQSQREEITSRSMGTTEGSSRVGGKGQAPINPPTKSSDVFSNHRRTMAALYTQDTSLALKTPQTPLPEVAFPPSNSFSMNSPSQTSSTLSWSVSDPAQLVRNAALKRLRQAPDLTECDRGTHHLEEHRKRHKPTEARPRPLPIPQASTPSPREPAPYPRNLTPIPSRLRPHCLARDRLKRWIPFHCFRPNIEHTTINDTDRERVKETMIHAWEEDTRAAYGAGLLMWHCFCDSRAIPEPERAPASQALVSAFVAHMAAAYSGKTISNYLYGIRAWHMLHSVPWQVESSEMETMLRAADKLTPNASKRKKRRPYTPEFIVALKGQMNLEDPLDAAVFACLVTCFYASARLGEFTVRTLGSFNPNTHATPGNLSYDQDRNGFKVTVLHLPRTKMAGTEGEDVYWASQEGDTDPTAALNNHLRVNRPSEAAHLFEYRAKKARKPLTKTKFLERVSKAARAAGLEPLQGHGIRIGSTLEYLLRGVPFDVMKAKGRWAGDSFLLYLRKHAITIAPYIQAAPTIHENFIRYTMPPAR